MFDLGEEQYRKREAWAAIMRIACDKAMRYVNAESGGYFSVTDFWAITSRFEEVATNDLLAKFSTETGSPYVHVMQYAGATSYIMRPMLGTLLHEWLDSANPPGLIGYYQTPMRNESVVFLTHDEAKVSLHLHFGDRISVSPRTGS